MPEPVNFQSIHLQDGRRLAFAEYGDPGGQAGPGPSGVVLHFHGSAGSRLDHPADNQVLLEQRLRFISVERPGHGYSNFQRRRRLVDWPADIRQMADHLGLQTFYVEGWSAGGPHALACACYLPDRVEAVALIASAAPMARKAGPGPSGDAFKGLPLPNLILAASARWAPPLTYAIRWLTRVLLLRDPEQASRQLMASIPESDKSALYEPGNLDTFVQSIRQGYRTGSRGVLINRNWGFDIGSIEVPVDIWHGQADRNVPIHGARYLASVRAFFLPGEGHFFVLKRWGEVLANLVAAPR